ncbi:MAG TPA: 16S rRNA (cytidine(1402)-2'-O)-methyltransferase [Polyangiaceae bacterium]|nr:16S rRNA (cytidine(1402)-2'-O)-methyltransferase [Polyangiaceae bacterium]
MPSASAEGQAQAPGALYVVATPIGNLGDLSSRAADTLRAVDRVLAEDTRRTRGLLSHLAITGKRLERLDAHASETQIASVVRALLAGETAALVSDAGVPGVSDPGAELVRAAVQAGIRVLPIAGPSALTAAVSVCEFVQGPFLFLGFLPRKGKKRKQALSRIAAALEPVVLFESAERIAATLEELATVAGERSVLVCRELTKLHEELVRGTLTELAASEREWLGEITVVIDAAPSEGAETEPDLEAIDSEIEARLATGEHTRDIAAALAEHSGLTRRELYERTEQLKRKGQSQE